MKTLCSYGCGSEGKFVLKNKKVCCSSISNKCEAIRKKNSEGLKKSYKTGKKQIYFTNEHRQQTIKERKAAVIEDLNTVGAYRSNCYLNKIIKEFNLLEYKCNMCDIESWNDKPITLELDHSDGDSTNCKLTNLRYLCPNCHSQTDTYKGKNINTGKKKISDEELLKCLRQHKSIRQALISVDLSPRGGNYARAAKLLLEDNNTKHKLE